MKNTTILALLLFTSISDASDSLSTKIHNPYTSLRAMGMGNAFTAVTDDYSLIFYNPAGFAKKRYNEVQFTLAGGGVSQKTMPLVKDISDATASGTDAQKATALSGVLDQYYGKSLGGKLQAAEIFWTRKNWGVALIPADLTIDISINRQLGPAIDLNVIGDTALAYGYGTEINKFLSAGVTAKYTHRVSIDQSVSALELASDPNLLSAKRFKEGQTVDLDLGVLWTPNWFNSDVAKTKPVDEMKVETKSLEPVKSEDEKRIPQSEEIPADTTATATTPESTTPPAAPVKAETVKTTPALVQVAPIEIVTNSERFPLTFSGVIRNVFGGSFLKTKMVNKDAVEAPERMFRTIDLGSQYQLAQFGNLTLRSMIDFKNILHPDITLSKSFHAGVEFDYYPNSWFKTQLRAGVNQMYFTGGATFLLGVLHIDAVTYGEEVGTTSTKMENRVYAAKVGFNF